MSIENRPCGEPGCGQPARHFAILGAEGRGLVFLCPKHHAEKFPR